MSERETVSRAEGRKKHSFMVDVVIRLVREKPVGAIGGVICLFFISCGIFSNLLAPYDWNAMQQGSFLKAPSFQYWLGTDELGRDMLSRIIGGARVSMIVGLVGTLLSTFVSVSIGLVSGYFGGKLDIVLQRFIDGIMCFPSLFLMLSIMAIIGQGMPQVIFVLGFTYGIRNSRIIRSAVISIKENLYVEAAQAIGCSDGRILISHLLPNIGAPVIIILSIGVGYMVMSEAVLSFLGYGIPPPIPSWGGMLSIGGRRYMVMAPWLALWPGIALTLVVWGVNMLGDALRDILDPRMRGGLGRYSGVKVRNNV